LTCTTIVSRQTNWWNHAQTEHMVSAEKLNRYHSVYVEYAPRLISFARKFTSMYAEDLVHDVFMKLWDSAVFDLPENELSRILFASVRNACIDHIRRLNTETKTINTQKQQLLMDELAFAEDAEELFIRKDLVEKLMQKADELPEKRKEVFLKTYVEGMKTSEIAEQLELSVRTVENHLYRALLFLRKFV